MAEEQTGSQPQRKPSQPKLPASWNWVLLAGLFIACSFMFGVVLPGLSLHLYTGVAWAVMAYSVYMAIHTWRSGHLFQPLVYCFLVVIFSPGSLFVSLPSDGILVNSLVASWFLMQGIERVKRTRRHAALSAASHRPTPEH